MPVPEAELEATQLTPQMFKEAKRGKKRPRQLYNETYISVYLEEIRPRRRSVLMIYFSFQFFYLLLFSPLLRLESHGESRRAC